jgi:acylphosphatase
MNVVKHLRIHGRVQGVGYRYTMHSRAGMAGVTGWVRNRRDGAVEAMLAGDEAAVNQLIAWARQGPPGASVSRVDIEDGEGRFDRFDMLRTE